MTPEELEEWLKDKPPEVAMAIAARCAARVLPLVIAPKPLALHAVKGTLITYVITLFSSVEGNFYSLTEAPRAALADAPMTNSRFNDAVYAVRSAMIAAAYMTGSPDVVEVRYSVVRGAHFTDDASGSENLSAEALAADAHFWEGLRDEEDLQTRLKTLLALPLWNDKDDVSIELTPNVLKDVVPDPLYRWFERTFLGRPQNWDMLRDFALIDPDIWDEGGAALEAALAEIEARYVNDVVPLAEKAEWNDAESLVEIIPIQMDPVEHWNITLDKLADALDDIAPDGKFPQHLTALKTVHRKLTRTLDRYADQPLRVHDDMQNQRDIILKLQGQEEVPRVDEDVDSLLNVLQQGTLDIRANVPEVREAVDRRVSLKLAELDDARKLTLRQAVEFSVDFTRETVGEDLSEDANTVLDRMADPQDPEVQSAGRRFIGRLERILTLTIKNAKKFEKSALDWDTRFSFYSKVIFILTLLLGL